MKIYASDVILNAVKNLPRQRLWKTFHGFRTKRTELNIVGIIKSCSNA